MGWIAWIQFLAETQTFLLAMKFRLALGPTQPPIQWVSWDMSPRVNQPEHEVTAHLHTMLRFKLHGDVTVCFLYAFMMRNLTFVMKFSYNE
jgi:hypothetical protein